MGHFHRQRDPYKRWRDVDRMWRHRPLTPCVSCLMFALSILLKHMLLLLEQISTSTTLQSSHDLVNRFTSAVCWSPFREAFFPFVSGETLRSSIRPWWWLIRIHELSSTYLACVVVSALSGLRKGAATGTSSIVRGTDTSSTYYCPIPCH